MSHGPGRVSLVGAGPGDPELLTRRALLRLRRADLVLYDALVPPEIVALARRAQRFSVGKRAGRPQQVSWRCWRSPVQRPQPRRHLRRWHCRGCRGFCCVV